MNYLPIVLEHSSRGDRSWDLFSRLLVDRIIFLGSVIDDTVANIVVAQLLFLDSQNNEQDIHLYINSVGGSVMAGLGIIDTMQYIKSSVSTICIGQACSMGALILSCGAKSKRFILPNARSMIHQVSSGASGQASDLEIQTRETLKLKKLLNEMLSKNTGQPIEKIEKDADRDFFMSAEESVQYGLVDSIVVKR